MISALSREHRKATVWIVATWLFVFGLFAVSLYAIVALPSGGTKWDRAIALGTCGGLPMVQLEDGSTWLRVGAGRVYRIEDPSKLTCG